MIRAAMQGQRPATSSSTAPKASSETRCAWLIPFAQPLHPLARRGDRLRCVALQRPEAQRLVVARADQQVPIQVKGDSSLFSSACQLWRILADPWFLRMLGQSSSVVCLLGCQQAKFLAPQV
jgi:hypothetical protein